MLSCLTEGVPCWLKGPSEGREENSVATDHNQSSALFYGYTIRLNQQTQRWEVFWQDEKQEGDFARRADAEEWIDELMPLNR
jgi:hypothetical protein